MNLADALISRTFPEGSLIVRQGDTGDDMYFVEDGEVQVSMFGNGEEKTVSRKSQSELTTYIPNKHHLMRAAREGGKVASSQSAENIFFLRSLVFRGRKVIRQMDRWTFLRCF